MKRRAYIAMITIFLLGSLTSHSLARTFFNQEEAFKEFFPSARVERQTHYLSELQEKQIAEAAGSKLRTSIIYAYEVYEDDELLETLYFDQHRVRTLPETLMIGVSPEGTITRMVVMVFSEPLDYLPKERWYGQFLGKKLEPELRLGRQIDGITGATLSARATTQASRRVLAIHHKLGDTE